MRLLTVGNMYPPHHLGGYELMWRSAVGHLREWGHSVRVLTTDYRAPTVDPSTPEDAGVFRELRWYWKDYEFPPMGGLARLRLERHNAAVIDRHLREFAPNALGWWAMGGMSLSLFERVRRAGVPAIGMVHDDWMLYAPLTDAWTRAFLSRPRLAWLAERLTGVPTRFDPGAAASWLFVSQATQRRALDHVRTPLRAEVAHSGIDTGLFRPAALHTWGWRLLYVGRIEERKGVDLAVDALALLPFEATLEVIGRGNAAYLERLRSLVADRGLAGRVRFASASREELPRIYADADALLFPVRWPEPWGLVPLEAMAVGTPVAATGRGGSGEYLRHEENCLIFDPDRGPEALAAVVSRLAEDGALRTRLREGGLATAPRFSEQSFTERVEAALERAVASGGVNRRPAG